MPLHVLRHPLAAHLLTQLRDRRTEPQFFRTLSARLTLLLAIEATRDLPLASQTVETPLEPAEGNRLARPLVAVAILRAGLGMTETVTGLFPEVSVGYVGMERDEATAQARAYYCKLPPLEDRMVLLLDPMLATGGSAEQTIDLLRARGARDLRFLCVVAAPEGVARLTARFPELPIHTAALDRQLDDRKYIRPGLGDFGDRLFGTHPAG